MNNFGARDLILNFFTTPKYNIFLWIVLIIGLIGMGYNIFYSIKKKNAQQNNEVKKE